MPRAILDASAVLALLQGEPGADEVSKIIADSLISVANEAEVIGRLISLGQSPAQALEAVDSLPYTVVDLERATSRRAGSWWGETRPQGLSLADRCCLALAERMKLPALTADRIWAKITLNVEVKLIGGRGGR